MPTILAICSAAARSPAGPLDGLDASKVLLGGSGDDSINARDLFYFCGEKGLDDEQIALTSADGWKSIVTGPDVRRPAGCQSAAHQLELYRLRDDPYEQHHVADAEQARVKEMSAKLVWFRGLEPHPSVPPNDRKPPDFKPPPHWHIPPQ